MPTPDEMKKRTTTAAKRAERLEEMQQRGLVVSDKPYALSHPWPKVEPDSDAQKAANEFVAQAHRQGIIR